ncbi:unnamed protein product [Timema podura]|uniref:Major facilitator superfamily (MFS) profile domain-containing protein n=1 Tax=Timema podura TaxID=61482 RepID=A0ABN7NQB2_TIMPD|nr:unnamed protein product [Timema podura]
MKKEQSYDVVVDVSNDKPKGTNLGDGGTVKKVELLPPEGGWGWAIAFGMALSTMIVYPVMQTFAFVYKDKLTNVGLTATDSSIIINTNAAFGMVLGLVHGTLLNRFSYRKVGITASIVFFIGVLLTSFCNSFISFLLSYGIITSLGLCLFMPAFSLAINSYFKVKRNIAMGFAMTLTGMGTVIMPPVISKLLSFYGVQGTGLIMAALSLHSLVGALLLQPIKWHLKKKVVEPEPKSQDAVDQEADHTDHKNSNLNGSLNRSSLGSNTKIFDDKLYIPLKEYDANERGEKQENEDYNLISDDTKKTNGSSLERITTDNLVSLKEAHHNSEIKNNGYDEKVDEAEDKGCLQKFIGKVVNELDLSLFKDPHYTNLILGMSIAICAEANFSLMTPFILSDLNFTNDQIATVMSSIGIVDIIFRCISPFFADYMKYTAKTMYLISMAMLISSRTVMIFITDFKYILIVAIALGAAKGVRTVFMFLVVPSHVPIERLASANGLQIVTNGVFLMVFGPLVGKYFTNCLFHSSGWTLG